MQVMRDFKKIKTGQQKNSSGQFFKILIQYNPMQKLWLISTLTAFLVFASIYGALYLYSQAHQEPVSFSMNTHEGGTYVSTQDSRFKLVFFGFTHCPDICPTALSTMSKALRSDQKLSETVAPLFISIDPERDTPTIIDNYIKNFEPSFIGLVGSSAELEKVQKTFKVYAQKIQPPEYEDYLMDHSTHIYLLNKDDMIIDVFDYRIDAAKMARKIQNHI